MELFGIAVLCLFLYWLYDWTCVRKFRPAWEARERRMMELELDLYRERSNLDK